MPIVVQWTPTAQQSWIQLVQSCAIPVGVALYGNLLRAEIELWAQTNVLHLNQEREKFFDFAQDFVDPPCAQGVLVRAIRVPRLPQGQEVVEILRCELASPN